MSKPSTQLQPTSTDEPTEILKPSVIASLSRRWHLSPGWENFFRIRGNGMIIECPICREAGINWRPTEADPVAALEGDHEPRHVRTRGRPKGATAKATRQAAPDQVKRGGSWKQKSAKARLDEAIRRMRQRTDPMGKSILKGLLRKKRGVKPKTNPKQMVYAARSKARKLGQPLPPLPGESKAA